MDSENFRSSQEIPNLNLSDYEEQSLDSDSQLLSPDDLSFIDVKSPESELPSKLKPPYKNIPYTKTAELNDSLISKMSSLKLTNLNERPDSLVIGKTTDIDINVLESLDSGKDCKQNMVLETTTEHPLKILSPDIDYPDVVPKISSESKLDTGLNNGFTPQRNNSKSNLYVENVVSPEYQSFIDTESKDILISPSDFVKVNAENLLNNEMIKRKSFNNSILCKNSSTPINNVIKQDVNVGAIRIKVQNSNKSECDRNISNAISEAEKDESYHDMPEWGEESSDFKSFSNYELPMEMTNPAIVNRCPQSPDILSSPSQSDKSKYQAIIDPYSCNVMLKHTPAADSGVRQTMRRRIVIPEDNISTDSGSMCSLELEDDSEELQTPNPHVAAQTNVLERDRRCEVGESSGVRDTTVCGDVTPSNAVEKSTSTSSSSPIPEYSREEEQHEVRSWMQVSVPGGERVACDMRVIEPFKRVLSHGGYTDNNGAIIVISACRLPHSARADYRYVMSHLFLYVMYTIEKLVTDSYVLVYVHGAASKGRIPSWHWLKESYKLIDRRLRKSMKRLYLVHPTFWLKSLLLLSKPFVSHKFYNKVTYVKNLRELMQRIPVEPNAIPDIVKDYDSTLE